MGRALGTDFDTVINIAHSIDHTLEVLTDQMQLAEYTQGGAAIKEAMDWAPNQLAGVPLHKKMRADLVTMELILSLYRQAEALVEECEAFCSSAKNVKEEIK